jgi:polyisoprenoid-binding protein YceI
MATYKIDPDHSDIMFKVKHLMISTVTGIFKKFDATLEVNEDDLNQAQVTFEADITSVDTKNEQRDGHLKSDDFFNAEKFPKMTFKSTSIEKTGDDEYRLIGDLTIRDITKPVELKVEYNGKTKDPWGQERMGFEVSGKINRREYGLKWSAVTEAGGLVVADDVKLAMNVEMVKQAA